MFELGLAYLNYSIALKYLTLIGIFILIEFVHQIVMNTIQITFE